MGVVKTGDDPASVEIDDLRIGSSLEFRGIIDSGDTTINDNHFLCFGMLGIKGGDVSILEDEIGYRFHEYCETLFSGYSQPCAILTSKGMATQVRMTTIPAAMSPAART